MTAQQIQCQLGWQSFNRLIISVMFFIIAMSCDDLGKKQPLAERPIQTTFKVEDFNSATDCQNCHPNHYEEWSASMHAYSTQDPVWFKLQQNAHNSHAAKGVELGDFCVQCHSPIAALTDAITDHENLTPEIMSSLPIQIQEGVTCDVCHSTTHLPESTDIQTAEQNFETADFKLYMDGTRYSIIDDPQNNSFHESEFHEGYDQSDFCRNCHNLTVNGMDAEVTNFEWEGTAFEAMGSECQTCHMPTYEGYAAEGGPLRENLHRHYFPGVGTSIIAESENNGLLPAISEILDGSADVNIFEPLADTLLSTEPLTIKLIISNNAGHNFPSGVTFTRQLWLEVIASIDGDTIFHSGHLNENGDIYDFYTDPEKLVDPQLNVFNTVLYNEAGDSGIMNVSVEDMVWMNDYTLPVSGSRMVNYIIDLPTFAPEGGSTLEISARLRFRSFPPFLLRHINLNEEVERLLIWDIDQISTSAFLE
ncbi:MAG: multiheme c-type cytochrome [Candidatus Marinimicrobia bacterium]|nr:multiheme c-type cytochrome [Candidatus Neomarinimicrobiota bacterium]